MKKVFAAMLVALTIVTTAVMPVSAQTGFFLGQNSYSYNGNKSCVCTLTKPNKKDAKVTVRLTTTNCALSVKMTDAKGRHIWSENYSMGVGANRKNRSKRTYVLGKDHAVYQLYFKATNGKGTGFCSVNDPKNCTIK